MGEMWIEGELMKTANKIGSTCVCIIIHIHVCTFIK